MSRLSDAEARERIAFDFAQRSYRRPPEMAGHRRRWPVAIVGGGPVGLQMALELERFGIDCVVLHAGDAVSLGSRAICIAGRSLDILQRVGIGEDFRRKGLAWTHGKSYYRSDLVYELEMPDDPRVRHRPMTNLQQYYMEQFAVTRAEDAAHVDLRWQHRFVDLARHDDHVVCRVETPEGGYELEADYLVACDGARSSVRDALGLKLHGTSSTGRYLICDIRMACDRPTERVALFDPACNPGATMLLHKQPDNTWRLDFQLPDADDVEAELDLERLVPRIESALEMLGETAPWELLWASLYKAHALALGDYRHGRVLFAGDAAHLVPIFGVRGLNSGYADANNLGWKLAAVHHGEADEALLDTYNTERRAATMDILENARKSTAFMTPSTPGYELMRDAALSLAVTEPFARCLVNPRQSQPYDYVDSPLTTPDDGGGVRSGAPLPNLLLSEGHGEAADYLLDRLADGFNALCFIGDEQAERRYADLAAEMAAVTPQCRLLPVVDRADRRADAPARILDRDHRLAAALGAGGVLLVRPDDHVCARLPELDASNLKKALGRASMAARAETA